MSDAPVIYIKPRPRRKILIETDIHWEDRDRTAFAIKEAFRRWWDAQPDGRIAEVWNLGDIANNSAVSHWDNPVTDDKTGMLRARSGDEFRDEMYAIRAYFAMLRREHPQAALRFTFGNHERWVTKLIWNNARGLGNILNLIDLWELDKVRIEWVAHMRAMILPYGVGGKLVLTHGHKAGTRPAKAMYTRYKMPGFSGHVHRADREQEYNPYFQDWMIWDTLPALCNLTPSYHDDAIDWQHGFAVAWHDSERNILQRETLFIKDGVLRFQGWEFGIEKTPDGTTVLSDVMRAYS